MWAVRRPVRKIMPLLVGATPAEREVLEYVDVLEYAAARRDEGQRIGATILHRKTEPGAWLVTQAFTDENHQLIRTQDKLLGRQLLVKAFDEELAELFGEAESITIDLP
jgi:hypothetical protein